MTHSPFSDGDHVIFWLAYMRYGAGTEIARRRNYGIAVLSWQGTSLMTLSILIFRSTLPETRHSMSLVFSFQYPATVKAATRYFLLNNGSCQ